MECVTIDCTSIQDKADFHTALAEALHFPGYYGKNLDALHDCLTEICMETQLQFTGWEDLEKNLGLYAALIQRAMKHAAGENPCFQVSFD